MRQIEQEVRIFVSSTFADLRIEREALATVAIPALEEFATSHGVHLNLLDLRWGLESGETIDDELIAACFHAIDSCRPFFLGIVGSRQGTIISGIGGLIYSKHNWVRARDRWAITELEMEYGALSCANGESLFYLREDRDDEYEVCRLKQRIRKSGLPFVDGYRSTDELVSHFVADVKAIILRVANDFESPDTDERSTGRVMLPTRLPVDVVPLTDQLAKLRRTIDSGHQKIAIVGPRGCGKTSLISAWGVESNAAGGGDVLSYTDPGNHVVHWHNIVDTLVVQAMRLRIFDSDLVRDDASERSFSFDELVVALRPKRDLTFVVDPVDRIALPSGIQWLPKSLPLGMRLIVTANSNPPATTLRELQHIGFHLVELDWLSEMDRDALLTGLVGLRGRILRKSAREFILRSRSACSASFLSAAAMYLIGYANYEDLDEHAARVESLSSPSDIIALELARLTDLLPQGRVVVAALAAASRVRHGVSVDDLRKVVTRLYPTTPSSWPRVRLALLRYVRQLRDGFLVPRPEAREAILSACSEEEAQAAEKELLDVLIESLVSTGDRNPDASYFEFVLSRLVSAKRTREVVTLLCSSPLCKIEREYWLSCGRYLFLDFKNLEELLPQTFESADLASRVAELQQRLGLGKRAIVTQGIAIDLYEKFGDRCGAALARSQLATWVLTDNPSAELDTHIESLTELKQAGSLRVADMMITVSAAMRRMGRFTEALVELELAVRLAGRNPSVAANSAVQRALIHIDLGFAEDAMILADTAVLLSAYTPFYTVAHEAYACRAEINILFGHTEAAIFDFQAAIAMAMMGGHIVRMMELTDRSRKFGSPKIDYTLTFEHNSFDLVEAERKIFGPGALRRWGEAF